MAAETASASPHSAYRELRVAMGQEDGNRHFGERPPPKKNESRNCRVTLVGGKSLFYYLASPFCLRGSRLSAPPSFNHRHLKESPPPLPAYCPAAGKSFPGAKRSIGGNDGNCTDGNGSFYPDTRWQGGGAGGGCMFSVASPPDLFSFAPPSRRRWTRQLRFYPVPGACALEVPRPLVGVE